MSRKHLIFVDGQEGTTGLKIHEMLAPRDDLEVLPITLEKRKDPSERARLINEADLVFLCLPDAASREAVAMVTNPSTRVIDASAAFRTDPTWVYGLPELGKGQRERIRSAKRLANPGCHATAFILLVRPLVDAGLIPKGASLSATSITGFSGGGRKMIEDYEAAYRAALESRSLKASPPLGSSSGVLATQRPGVPEIFSIEHAAPRPYAMGLTHKHLPEMTLHGGLRTEPVFMPVVGPFYQGLTVSVSLAGGGSGFGEGLHACLHSRYAGEPFVRVLPLADKAVLEHGFFDSQRCNQTNLAELYVFENGRGQALLMACIDNLGKGASGAAVQNMNLMLGIDETAGLAVHLPNQIPS